MSGTLEDLLSQDSQRIWQAPWEIITSRDTELLEQLRAALPQISQATADIELDQLITPNSATLEHTLTKVHGYRSWKHWCDDHPRLPELRAARRRMTTIARTWAAT